MIWLSLVAFVVAALVAGLIVRWLSGHASVYGNGMPQRFHLGDVPRVGGARCCWECVAAGAGVAHPMVGTLVLRLAVMGLWLLVVLLKG